MTARPAVSARYRVELPGGVHVVEVDEGRVRVDGREFACDLAAVGGEAAGESGRGGARFSLLVDGRSRRMTAARRADGRWELLWSGRAVVAEVLGERAARMRDLSAATRSGPRAEAVRAPMPGLVVQVAVSVGDEVAAGDRVVVVEAMKMENELRAAAAGTVAKVLVEDGAAVDKGDVLVQFEAMP